MPASVASRVRAAMRGALACAAVVTMLGPIASRAAHAESLMQRGLDGAGTSVEQAAQPGASQSRAATESAFFHWNVQGLIGNSSDSRRLDQIEYIRSRAVSEQFISISLNELCLSQAFSLAYYLNGSYSQRYEWKFHRPWNAAAGNCRLDGNSSRVEYGNQVLSRFTFASSLAARQGSAAYSAGTDSYHWPNIVCIDTTAFLNAFHSCSTHFGGWSTEEADFYNYTIFSTATYHFGMGDLNRGRASLPGSYQTDFREADLTSPKRSTTDGGTGIDYIYAVRPNTASAGNATITILGMSDHHSVRGYFDLL